MEKKIEDNITSSPDKTFTSEMNSGDTSDKMAAAGRKPSLKVPPDYQDSPLSKSMDFVHETKYVMLNFMSLVPPEMYSGHVSSSSLGSASSGLSSPVSPHFRHISKSKSFDIGIHSHRPHSRRVDRLKSRAIDFAFPHSENNIANRYRQYRLESPDEGRFNSDPGSPPELPFEHSRRSSSSTQLSPHKALLLLHSQSSVVSSSGDLSYVSDADDEGDDFSNASSIFSSHSLHNCDGFLDLRKSVHILPPLYSQSEEIDGIDELTAENGDHGEDKLEDNQAVDEVDGDNGLDQGSDVAGFIECHQRPVADRSKLKLNIPCEPVMLDDILVSLHTELSSEIDELESEFEEALRSSHLTPLTPQSEAARVLARIGDEVKAQYGSQLSAAVNRLTYEQVNYLSYEQFREIALSIVDIELPGWRQVALLMVFGQKVVWNAVQQGQKQFGGVIDLCTQLVADEAADFIIKQGGWNSVMNFDPSQSSDTVSSAELDSSNDMNDFFSSHNVTQVDSRDTTTVTDSETQAVADSSCELIKSEHDIDINVNESKYQHSLFKPTVDDKTKDFDQMASYFEYYGETFVEDDDSGNAQANGLQIPTVDSLDRSTNKARYAPSVGFEYEGSTENMDMDIENEDDVSLSNQQDSVNIKDDGMKDNDKSKGEVEGKNDQQLCDGRPCAFFTIGSLEDNLIHSSEENDLISQDLEPNEENEHFKPQTAHIPSNLVRQMIPEHNNNHMIESDKRTAIEAKGLNNENVTQHIVIDESLITNTDTSVEQNVQVSLDLSNENASNEILSVSQSDVILDDASSSSAVDEFIDSGLNTYTYDTEDVSDVTDIVGNLASLPENSDNSREITDCTLPYNQRETTHDNLNNLSQNSDNNYDYIMYSVRRRRVQVCILSIAALAVAVGVKIVSAR
ncbi:hypothetical protein ACF0H5_008578 [Mactra antiquata]